MYNTKNLKTDVSNTKPVPQYYNEDTDDYEPLKGSGGAAYMKQIGAATEAKQDAGNTSVAAINTATGAQDDAEAASGNGSVISILKAIRTYISSTIKTLGAAIGTKATLIAGSDGTNAQAIKTNASGEQLVVLTGSIPSGANTIGKVDVNGRSAVDHLIFNAKAITNTSDNFSTGIDTTPYKRQYFEVYNTHNQEVTLVIISGSSLFTSWESGAWSTTTSVNIPAGGTIRLLNTRFPFLETLKNKNLIMIAKCAVAPSSGSLTVTCRGVPN